VTAPADPRDRTVAALCARERRSADPAVQTRERAVSYHTLITDTYRAGNALRYLGVDVGDRVAIDTTDLLRAVPAILGAAQLGAVVAIGQAMADAAVGVLQAPLEAPAPYDRVAVYGAAPSTPTAIHWEATMWSENPAIHPVAVEEGWTVLTDGRRTWTHAEVMQRVQHAGPPTRVRGPITAGRRLIDDIIAPLAAGDRVRLST
jgi:hypothetical protein